MHRQTKADRKKNLCRRNKTKTPCAQLPPCQVTKNTRKYPLFILILMRCIFFSQLSKGLDVCSRVYAEMRMPKSPTSISSSPQSPQHATMTSVNTFLILMASLSPASEQLNSSVSPTYKTAHNAPCSDTAASPVNGECNLSPSCRIHRHICLLSCGRPRRQKTVDF